MLPVTHKYSLEPQAGHNIQFPKKISAKYPFIGFLTHNPRCVIHIYKAVNEVHINYNYFIELSYMGVLTPKQLSKKKAYPRKSMGKQNYIFYSN